MTINKKSEMIDELLSPKKAIAREESMKTENINTISFEMPNENANKSLVHNMHSMNPIGNSLCINITIVAIRPPSTPERINHDFAFDIEKLLKTNDVAMK